MPTNIYEQADLLTVDVEGEFISKTHSKYTNVFQLLIDSGDYVLVPYAASALELTAAIALKQQEVRAHYEGLHGESLASVVKRQTAASPSVVTTANAVSNIAIADGGIAAIAALIDKATVDAYSVVGLSWS